MRYNVKTIILYNEESKIKKLRDGMSDEAVEEKENAEDENNLSTSYIKISNHHCPTSAFSFVQVFWQ